MSGQFAVAKNGAQELRQVRDQSLILYVWVALFSFFANLLMLAGPLYMMQVYDRVLGSKSEATLVALSLIIVFLYVIMGALDFIRGRLLARAAARFQTTLEARVFTATLAQRAQAPKSTGGAGLQDLDALHRFLASPALQALFDAPWTPVFLIAIWAFHPALGVLALAGGAALITVTFLNQRLGRGPLTAAQTAEAAAQDMANALHQQSEVVQSLGMRGAAFDRWQAARHTALRHSVKAADRGGLFTVTSRTLRLLLQSAMLGLGAYLVLQQAMSAGAMIAASVLLGRALAPVEAAIGQWPLIQQGRRGWQMLSMLLGQIDPPAPRTALPPPQAQLSVKDVTMIPPGDRQAVLRMINFDLHPGQACGVIGPSGAGKSTLARALTGIWAPAGGTIRLDSAILANYDPDTLGRCIGYLPQKVDLFEGTIAENIARLSPDPDPDLVHEAAKRAGAYEMILELPDGFDTRINTRSRHLSGGQIQRIGLARALYGDPVIVILDEPNSNLDSDGNAALNAAVRDLKARGRIALVMAHRPAAIQECDVLLMIEGGVRKAFGPKETVLRKMVQNHSQIRPGQATGGVA